MCLCLLLAPARAALGATRVVAPDGADAEACVDAACRTLAYAYGLAQPGDTIELVGGDHGAQEVPAGSKRVTVRGLPGNRVSQLANWAHNVTFDALDVDAGGARAAYPPFENHGTDNVTFANGRIGNVTDQKGALVGGANFTFENVEFHDVRLATPGVHLECVYAVGVPRFVLRDSTFRGCAVMDLLFAYAEGIDPPPPPYGDVTIENTVFGHTLNGDGSWNYYALYIGQTGSRTLDGWVVRHNTFEQGASLGTSHDRATGSRWVGNVGGWDCVAGMRYSHNVGQRCGPTDRPVTPVASVATRVAPFGWRDPAHGDFHLTSASPARAAGDPADHPELDRDGAPRRIRPDAGAYEYADPVLDGPACTGGDASIAVAVLCAGLRLYFSVVPPPW
jgi:hypothetical protein